MISKRLITRIASALALSLICFGVAGAAKAEIVLHIEVDTASIAGTDGHLDFQLNPGSSGAQTLSAAIKNFSSNGTLGAASETFGDVAGSLADDDLILANTSVLNYAFYDFQFGESLSFDVTFTGEALDAPGGGLIGNIFALTLYDLDFNPLLNISGREGALEVDFDGSGAYSITRSDWVTASDPPPPNAIPEPATLVMVASGLGLLLARGRRLSGRARRAA